MVQRRRTQPPAAENTLRTPITTSRLSPYPLPKSLEESILRSVCSLGTRILDEIGILARFITHSSSTIACRHDSEDPSAIGHTLPLLERDTSIQ